MKRALPALLILAIVPMACASGGRSGGGELERRVLDSGSLRRLAIAGSGHFARAPLVADCLATVGAVPPPCRAVRRTGPPVVLRTGDDGALRFTTGAQAATVSVLVGPPLTDSVAFAEATPLDEGDRRRWRLRLGDPPTAGDTIVVRVASMRTDSGYAEFLVQAG